MLRKIRGRLVFWTKSLLGKSSKLKSMVTGFVVLQRETYLKMLENSIGSRMFSTITIRCNDKEASEDLLRNGDLSCAWFVSSVLHISGMIGDTRATVKGLRETIENSFGWEDVTSTVSAPEAGDVIFWEKMRFAGDQVNEHVGVAVSSSQAVSTSDRLHMVVKHDIRFGSNLDGSPKRRIVNVFRYRF